MYQLSQMIEVPYDRGYCHILIIVIIWCIPPLISRFNPSRKLDHRFPIFTPSYNRSIIL